MDDVRTLLRDSDLRHSYWAEAAAYSIDTRNLIPSRRHPGRIPQESFMGKRQGVAHLRVFRSKCWAKTPVAHGGSKLDPRSSECRLLGYATGSGNYKVQDIATCHVFVSHDVIFEEGSPHRTTAGVGEQIPLFDANMVPNDNPPANNPTTDNPQVNNPTTDNPHTPESAITNDHVDQHDNSVISIETCRSAQVPQPLQAGIQSNEYKQREILERGQGKQWVTDQRHPTASTTIDCADEYENVTACFTDTKASHFIPRSYHQAMTTDPDRWMAAMKTEIDTLKMKHTWDLVKSPPGANIMGLKWIYDIKWDGEGNRIKDKARLVGKGYTQQLGVDYNETWAGVTRLESVRMTAAIVLLPRNTTSNCGGLTSSGHI